MVVGTRVVGQEHTFGNPRRRSSAEDQACAVPHHQQEKASMGTQRGAAHQAKKMQHR
jgi:hypothetical protein